jgi:hypothetical protein
MPALRRRPVNVRKPLILYPVRKSQAQCHAESGIRYLRKILLACGSRGEYFYSVQQKEKIMTIRKVVVALLVAGLAVAGLSACEKEGPAEKTGKAIDEAASDMADSTKEAMEDIEKKVKE